jgi:opacity protein-like surface antigen
MALDAAAWAAPSLAEEAQKSNGGYIAARYVFNTSIRAEVDIGNPPETASASGRAPAFAAAYGYEFSGSRLEAELSAGNRLYALSAGGKELSFEAASLFINGYADFATGTWLTPYIGAGFGVSRTAVSTDIFDGYDISGGDNTGWSIGYLITLGASAEIGGGWSAEIAWRRVDFGTPPSYSAEASQTGSNAPSFVIHQYLSATSNAAIFGFRRRF